MITEKPRVAVVKGQNRLATFLGHSSSDFILNVTAQPLIGERLRLKSQSILERIAAGEQHAVNECLDRYGNLVWSLARRYLRNAADAEDAVQDIFIDIWSSAGRYDRNIASEVAFISTIARRRLIDKLRKADRRPAWTPLTMRKVCRWTLACPPR